MIRKVFRAVWIVSALAAGTAPAATPDDAVLGAYTAYTSGDPLEFARYAKDLEGHPLAPWIAYWGLSMRLEAHPDNPCFGGKASIRIEPVDVIESAHLQVSRILALS